MYGPVSLKICKDNANSNITTSIIRIVFALAAKEPSLKVVMVRSTDGSANDIWCSGLFPDILVPVHKKKHGIWQALLHGWQEIYSGKDVPQGLRRPMDPGAALDRDYWSQWTESGVSLERTIAIQLAIIHTQ